MGQQLPTWTECEAACGNETATPLERFIYHHEPPSFDDPEIWREGLMEVVTAAQCPLAEKVLDAVWLTSEDPKCSGILDELNKIFAAEGIELTSPRQQEGE